VGVGKGNISSCKYYIVKYLIFLFINIDGDENIREKKFIKN
jgi:hypothetical protein